MTLSLLALFILPLYLKLVLDPKGSHEHFKNMRKDETVQMHTAAGMLLLALLIFSTSTPHFAWSWDSILTWMAILLVVKAVLFLMPGYLNWLLKPFNEKTLPIYGFVGLLAGFFFVFVDTQMLG